MCDLRELMDGVVGPLSIMFDKPLRSSKVPTDCQGETEPLFSKRKVLTWAQQDDGGDPPGNCANAHGKWIGMHMDL